MVYCYLQVGLISQGIFCTQDDIEVVPLKSSRTGAEAIKQVSSASASAGGANKVGMLSTLMGYRRPQNQGQWKFVMLGPVAPKQICHTVLLLSGALLQQHDNSHLWCHLPV